MKFKTTLLLSIFLFQQTSTIGIRIENWINNKTEAKVALIFDVHEPILPFLMPFQVPLTFQAGQKEKIILEQLERVRSLENQSISTKVYYEDQDSPAQFDLEYQKFLKTVPYIINPEKLIPSDKRIATSNTRIIEHFSSCFSESSIEPEISNFIIKIARQVGVKNIREMRMKIFDKLQTISDTKEKNSILSDLDEKFYLTEPNLDEELNLEFAQLIEKLNSISKELKKEILDDKEKHYGLRSYLHKISSISYKINTQNMREEKLDEMEQFIVDELQKNNFDSIVLVGGQHAAKISNYLKKIPEFTLFKSHGPEFELPEMSLEKLKAIMDCPPLEADQITL